MRAGIKMTTYFLINLLKVMTISVGRGKFCPADLNSVSKTGMTKIINIATTMRATPTMVAG